MRRGVLAGLVDSTRLGDSPEELRRRPLVAVAGRGDHPRELGPLAYGDEEGQGHLAFAQISEEALARPLELPAVVERVVDELEGDAEAAPELAERVDRARAGAPCPRPRAQPT